MTTVQYQMTSDHFKAAMNGRSYDAPLDGTQVPMRGDPGNVMVSVKRIDPNTIQQTDSRQGKVISQIHIAAASDGKTINYEYQDLEAGQNVSMILDKQ